MTNILGRLVRDAVGRGGSGDAVGSRGDSDGGEGGTVSAAGVSVSTAGVTVTTAGVALTTAGVAGVSTSVAGQVTFLSLVVLSDLDTLLDVVEFNADDSVLRYTVDGGRWAIVRRDAVVTVGAGARVGLVLDLVLQDDVLDFGEEMGVNVVAFGGLVSNGHGAVVAAAAANSSDSNDGRVSTRRVRGSGVAVADWRLSSGATQEGESDLLTN